MKKIKAQKSSRGRKIGAVKLASISADDAGEKLARLMYGSHEDTDILIEIVRDFLSNQRWIQNAINAAHERDKPGAARVLESNTSMREIVQELRLSDWQSSGKKIQNALGVMFWLASDIVKGRPTRLMEIVNYHRHLKDGNFQPVDELRAELCGKRSMFENKSAKEVLSYMKSRDIPATFRGVQRAMNELRVARPNRGRPIKRQFYFSLAFISAELGKNYYFVIAGRGRGL